MWLIGHDVEGSESRSFSFELMVLCMAWKEQRSDGICTCVTWLLSRAPEPHLRSYRMRRWNSASLTAASPPRPILKGRALLGHLLGDVWGVAPPNNPGRWQLGFVASAPLTNSIRPKNDEGTWNYVPRQTPAEETSQSLGLLRLWKLEGVEEGEALHVMMSHLDLDYVQRRRRLWPTTHQ